MKLSDYDFKLDDSLIAQTPLKNRSDSKMLILDKKTKEIEHTKFSNIFDHLNKNDVLVLNNSRVIPARLYGIKEDTKANIELLLLKQEDNLWEALVKPAKRVKIGTVIDFGEGVLKAKCVDIMAEGLRKFEMIYEGIFLEVLEKLGEMPLPPYIHQKLDNQERYQTVYSKESGSAAAPTAGLHFTKELIREIEKKGVEIIYVTLHVGLGTFRPVTNENVLEHTMHEEYYEVNEEAANRLNKAIKDKKNIISVGTTTTRVLESAYNNKFQKTFDKTNIFIYPGYKFKVVDSLITNFHLPKSTLLMLISALVDRKTILDTYKVAIEEKYRFFSFGDSMYIKNKEEL